MVESSAPEEEDLGDHAEASCKVISVCAFVACTGFFHGYDNGVVSLVFTMPSFREMMHWPAVDDDKVAFSKGLTVNGFNAGAALTAVLSGHLLIDKFGRKPALLIGSTLFAMGGLLQSLANSAELLIGGRLVAGIGVGITSAAGPAYISEVSPSSIRGAMIGIYQNNVCVAIIFASLLNYLDQGESNGWRWSLGVQCLLGGLVAIGMLWADETPRFLESAGKSESALRVLASLRGGSEKLARKELSNVKAELEAEAESGSASWAEVVTNPYFRNIVIIGCFTQLFQILTGINAIVSYGGTLFEHLGVRGLTSALTPSIAFTIGNAIGSFLLVDKVGRRTLLLWGMLAMGVTLLAGGIINLMATERSADGFEHIPAAAGYAIIGMVVAFMFSFGTSWGFGAWLYCSEIMPCRIRGKAIGLSTAVNWGPANITSAFITPAMIAGPMGPGGTLIFFGCVCMVAMPFILACIPETKGLTLEQIVPLFHFSTFKDFRQFVRGNLRGGHGMAQKRELTETETETETD